MLDEAPGFQLGGLSRPWPTRPRPVGRPRGGSEALRRQVKALLCFGLSVTLPSVGDGRLDALKGRLCKYSQPALGHAVVAPLNPLIAGGLIKPVPAIPGQSRHDDLCDDADG